MLAFIIAAALASSPAEDLSWKASDHQGGKLMFTNKACPEENIAGSLVGMLAPSGKFYPGCWKESSDKKNIVIFRKLSPEGDVYHLMQYEKEQIRFECKQWPCKMPYEGAKTEGLDI